MDWGYNGFDEGFETNRSDEYTLYNMELHFPETKLGKLVVGRMKAPATLSRNWGGAYLPLSARQSPMNALTRSRDNGVRLTNTAFVKRMTWGVGVFNDWLSTGNSIGDNNTYVTGRVTGLLLDDQPNENLLQIGLGFRWTDFVEDTIRFHAAPGIPFVPDYLDTGDMPGNEARWLTGEFAWRKQNILLSGEHVRTELDSPTIGNPTFKGSYVWLEWTLTGESRSFNYETALFGRPIPSRDFTRGGKGLWSVGLAFSDTDLNQGPIDGGDMQQFTIGLNWYPQKSYKWSLEYGLIALDRQDLDSTSKFLHVVFHVSNL
jgi:phosphate-selective porin OprO/OprP